MLYAIILLGAVVLFQAVQISRLSFRLNWVESGQRGNLNEIRAQQDGDYQYAGEQARIEKVVRNLKGWDEVIA